jgi:4-hydroxy-3-methylbut-2-en-1-yl diphosphate synthase IspG/GcpE
MKFTTEIQGDVLGVGADVTKEFSLSRSPDVNAALIRWMQDVIKLTVEGIDRVDAKATLNLRQSVGFAELPVEQKVAQVAMEMASYWKFVEYGVNGVRVNRGAPFSFRSINPSPSHVAAIRKWAIDKALGIPADEIDAAAYNIAKSIKRRGIKGRPFLNQVLTDAKMDELVSSIAQVVGKEISISINV